MNRPATDPTDSRGAIDRLASGPVFDTLHGKPLRHPLHPLLVHFPIGLFSLSFLLDLVSFFWDNPALVAGAFYTMALGVVMALVAAVPGLADRADIRVDYPARRIANWHMSLNLVIVALYLVGLWLRYGQLEEPTVPLLPFAISLVAVILLVISGYLGGSLIYDDGVAVGRYRRHTPTPERTIRVSSAGQADPWVAVADDAALGERETLCVEVDGVMMAVVRIDGRLYAFQEYCTHRYGPLSEGTFHDHEVMCPWHRSCFDVRTGKVAHGPAQVDLKVFEVEARDGKIRIRSPRALAQG